MIKYEEMQRFVENLQKVTWLKNKIILQQT